MQRVCVFTGSSMGARPQYAELARQLGAEIASRGYELVYGGASVGLMGAVADSALAAGGKVTGVLPRGMFRREAAHAGLTRLIEVGSMHERKAQMAALADGFLALPGGFGTLDELFEITTWAQIGLHVKPIALLDANGYYEPLLAFVRHALAEGFIPSANADLLLYGHTPADVLSQMESVRPAATLAASVAPPEP